MNKLTKEEVAQRDAFSESLRKKGEALTEKLTIYNNKIVEMNEAITPLLEAYNAELKEAEEWRDAIVGKMEDYVGERSEKWADSDAASEFEDWKSNFENAELDELEIELPEEIDLPELEHADEIDNLPAEKNG